MDGEFSPPPEETPVFGSTEGRDLGDFLARASIGGFPLYLFGSFGGVEQAFLAPLSGQVPLAGGFTLAGPWVSPPEYYESGTPGIPPDFQLRQHLAGQTVFGFLGFEVRTHTTGLIDYAVRNTDPTSTLGYYSIAAEELIHPGRAFELMYERAPAAGSSLTVDYSEPQNPDFRQVPSAALRGVTEVLAIYGIHARRRSHGSFSSCS